MRRFVFIAFVFIAFVFLLLCKKEDPASEHLARGKGYLREGEYYLAQREFKSAIEIKPGDSQARFGYALAKSAIFFKNIEKVVDNLISVVIPFFSLSFSPRFFPYAQTYPGTSLTINDFVESVIKTNFIEPSQDIIKELELVRKKTDWNFYIDSFKWKIDIRGKTFWEVDLGGEFDAGDANFLYSFFSAVSAVSNLILSIDFQLTLQNVPRILDFVARKGLKIDADFILSIIAFILNDTDNFLGIEPRYGVKRLREDFLSSFYSLAQGLWDFIEELTLEKDDQADDVISVLEISTTEVDGKEIRYPKRIAIPSSSKYIKTDEKRKKVEIEISPKIIKAVKDIMDIQKGKRISWGKDLVPIISISIVAILKTGMLDEIVDIITSGASQSTQQLISNVFSNLLKPSLVESILTSLIPDAVDIDIVGFLKNPIGIRDMLPAFSEDDILAVEWECLSDVKDISPLSPKLLFFCRNFERYVCFGRGGERCDVRAVRCLQSAVTGEFYSCENWCAFSERGGCSADQIPKDICLLENDGNCVKFGIEWRIISSSQGTQELLPVGAFFYEDSPHFKNFKSSRKSKQISPIPPDNLMTFLPYIGFQNPDFGGLLWLSCDYLKKFQADKICETSLSCDFKRPNLCEINIFIQSMAKGFFSILSQFGLL